MLSLGGEKQRPTRSFSRALRLTPSLSRRPRDQRRAAEVCLGQPWGDGDPAASYLDQAVTLELAHHLGDGLPGGGDHVRKFLVREAELEEPTLAVGLAEAVGQVPEQGGKPRRHLPAQEVFDRLVGLPEALGERRE